MAVLQICGFEGGNNEEIQTLTGTCSVTSAAAMHGGYGFRSNPTTTAVGHILFREIEATGVLANTALAWSDGWFEFWFRPTTLPASGSEELWTCSTTTALKLQLRVTSAGNLQAYDKDVVQAGSDGATTLVAGTWYRIGVRAGAGTSANYEVRLNGVSEIAASTCNQLAGNIAGWRFGKHTDRSGQSVVFDYDSSIVSSTAFLDAAHQILEMNVEANGSTMTFTAGAGDGDFRDVDEDVNDGATTHLISDSGGTGLFDLVSSATAGISGTIHAIKAEISCRQNSTGTDATAVRVRANDATNSDSTDFNHGNGYASQFLLLELNPSDAAAWETADLDTLEVGCKDNAGAVRIRLTYARVYVAFTPSAPVGGAGPVLGHNSRVIGSGRAFGGSVFQC